jgi:hypothetical protein
MKKGKGTLISSLYKPPAELRFRSMRWDHPVTVEPFQFLLAEPVAYEGSYPVKQFVQKLRRV